MSAHGATSGGGTGERASGGWWQGFFDDFYADFGLVGRDAQAIDQIVGFLMDKLSIGAGSTVFDQCCGIGRLSLPLARRGVRVIGVDQAASYVERARAEAVAGKLACEFHLGDAMRFVTPRPCDAAFNWFTSFGYHDDDAGNVRMLERAYESLKPGGRFGMDYLNVPRVLAEQRKCLIHRTNPTDPNTLLVLDEPAIDYARGMIDSAWTFIHPDGRREVRKISTRLMMPHELIAMLRRCGFTDCKLCGAVDGSEFDARSARCVVVAARG